MTEHIIEESSIPLSASGQRLDQVLAKMFPQYSRARLQAWLKSGELLIDGMIAKPKAKVRGGEQISLDTELQAQGDWKAEPIPLDIVHEDEHILVVNKPAGLVVHPAAGNYTGTLLNGLLHHEPAQKQIPRAGIVHRLDKDTTGLMVIAKTLDAQVQLVHQLQSRTVSREYEAIAMGLVSASGSVDAPIGRDPKHRKRMAVVSEGSGKSALTHYQVKAQFTHFTHLRLKLETGRTHQIRVHMSHIGHSLVGDQTYTSRRGLKTSEIDKQLLDEVNAFPRQALHAIRLQLTHPATAEDCAWEVDLPQDMQNLLKQMADLD